MALTQNSHTYSTLTLGAGGGSGYPSTLNISNNTTWSRDPTLTVGQAGQIELKGEDADLIINDVSLNETLRAIQAQLNVLVPNPALEAEWDELRELGELYRKKEAEFKEKKRMWEIMKKAE